MYLLSPAVKTPLKYSKRLQRYLDLKFLLVCFSLKENAHQMGRATRKRVFRHMRTANAQIRLRICAVWSGPSLSANRIIGYYRMYEWRANARFDFAHAWYESESVHFAYIRRHIFAWREPYIKLSESKRPIKLRSFMKCFGFENRVRNQKVIWSFRYARVTVVYVPSRFSTDRSKTVSLLCIVEPYFSRNGFLTPVW